MRQLYISVALPKITYGLDIWYTPPSKKPGQTKNSGSAAVLRQLQKTQRISSLAIIGALRTTPNDYADVHTGLLPMEYTLRKATHRAIIRILTLPPNHPLHDIVMTVKDNPPTRHASPIANFLRIYKLTNSKLETITPPTQLPRPPNKFTTNISSSREESITNEKDDKADFKVFSDGSGLDGGIGAAAIIYSNERNTPISHLKKYMGPKEKHNTYEAEIVGAILATWIIRNCPSTVAKTVSLYIDNQAVIHTIDNPKAKSGQYLLQQLNLLANSLACSLKIQWISSHGKVKGNEKVDELAKQTTLGKSSAPTSTQRLIAHQHIGRKTTIPRSAQGEVGGRVA